MDDAVRELEQAIGLMGSAAPDRDRAGAHGRLAELWVIQGELEQAQEHFRQALTLGGPEEQARAHIALGDLARRQGNFEEANHHLVEADQLITAIGHILQRAFLYTELGYAHFYCGRYDEASTAFQAAHKIFEDLKYQLGLAQTEHALGNVALVHQELEQARGHYERALKINTERRQNANAIFNRYQLALVDQKQIKLIDAEDGFKFVYDAATQMKNRYLEAAAMHQLAGIALLREELDLANSRIRQAAQIAEKSHDRLTEVSAMYYRGLLEAHQGDRSSAKETLSAALDAFVALNAPQADEVKGVLNAVATQPGAYTLNPRDTATGEVIIRGAVLGASAEEIKGGSIAVAQPIDIVAVGGTIMFKILAPSKAM
jgi:tetratricopeptide (TPR) repeat protein